MTVDTCVFLPARPGMSTSLTYSAAVKTPITFPSLTPSSVTTADVLSLLTTASATRVST